MGFLERLRDASRPAAEKEMDDLRDWSEANGGDRDIRPWDVMYISEKVKEERFSMDQEMIRPYFQLESTIEGAFEHARRLYDLEFIPSTDIEGYHKDVKDIVWLAQMKAL